MVVLLNIEVIFTATTTVLEKQKQLKNQGILSIPGVAGYKWVFARMGRLYQNNLHFTNGQLKTGIVFQTFPSSVFPSKNSWFVRLNLWHTHSIACMLGLFSLGAILWWKSLMSHGQREWGKQKKTFHFKSQLFSLPFPNNRKLDRWKRR